MATSLSAINRFYDTYGFTLYPNAYSHYATTKNAIPNMLNMSAHPIPVSVKTRFKEKKQIIEKTAFKNRVFDHLSSENYPIRVYQSRYMGFCKNDEHTIASCLTVNSALSSIEETPLMLHGKTGLLLDHFAASSTMKTLGLFINSMQFFSRTFDALSWLGQFKHLSVITHEFNKSSTLEGHAILERLFQDMLRDAPGAAYYAHVLSPHHPFVYDRECRLKPDPRDWIIHFDLDHSHVTGSDRDERYRAYDEQIACVYKTLEEGFQKLEKAGRLENMRFILHGDHGSRITEMAITAGAVLDERWPKNQMDAFSTLLAMRIPGQTGGIDTSARSVQDAPRAFYLNGGRFEDDPAPPWAYIGQYKVPLDHLPTQ
ncbi:MAG: hypothetical protein HQL50_14320 [Magnetococcales bacterium]|nr:hypothetical protein [Magnetococcales bacterium]